MGCLGDEFRRFLSVLGMLRHCCGQTARGCCCLLPVTSCPKRHCPVPTNPPLSESFALSVSSSLKVFLQAPPLCLQPLHLSSSPFSGANKSHFFQELLLLINEYQTIPLRVQHTRPGLAVKLSQLDFQVCYSAGKKKKKAVIPWGVCDLLQTRRGAPWPPTSSRALRKAPSSSTNTLVSPLAECWQVTALLGCGHAQWDFNSGLFTMQNEVSSKYAVSPSQGIIQQKFWMSGKAIRYTVCVSYALQLWAQSSFCGGYDVIITYSLITSVEITVYSPYMTEIKISG